MTTATKTTSVWYELLNPGAAGEPVVVVHGGPGTPHDYLRPIADQLPGHPVLFYDQLGCGRSEPGPGTWDLPGFVAELDTVVTDAGLDSYHLFGHSFGTMIACDAALRGDPRIRSLTLLSPVLSVRRYEQEMQRLLLTLPPDVARGIVAAVKGRPSAETAEAMLKFAERHYCRLDPWPDVLLETAGTNTRMRDALWGPTEFQVNGSLRAYHRTDRLGELELPVLLLCGAHDFTSPRMCAAFAAALWNAQLGVIENASHLAHLEEPVEFGKRLRQFLGEVRTW